MSVPRGLTEFNPLFPRSLHWILSLGQVMWSLEQIIGGAVAVIVAGMPAIIAVLKLNELHD